MKAFKALIKAPTVFMILFLYVLCFASFSIARQIGAGILLLVVLPILGIAESFYHEEGPWEIAQYCLDRLEEEEHG